MKLSELINQLTEMMEAHGDQQLDVIFDPESFTVELSLPQRNISHITPPRVELDMEHI